MSQDEEDRRGLGGIIATLACLGSVVVAERWLLSFWCQSCSVKRRRWDLETGGKPKEPDGAEEENNGDKYLKRRV